MHTNPFSFTQSNVYRHPKYNWMFTDNLKKHNYAQYAGESPNRVKCHYLAANSWLFRHSGALY